MKMMKNNTPSIIGKKIIKAIDKNQLLLLQDKAFPSVVATIVGGPITGSWWGHPMANPIYNGLNWAIDRHNILSAKLLSKNVTYISKDLYPYFFSIVGEIRDWQLKGIKKESLDLLKKISVSKDGVRSDNEKLKNTYPQLKKIADDLEVRLLIHTNEIHTESGKHAKEIRVWGKSGFYKGKIESYEASIEFFNEVVSRLNTQTHSKVKLPWA